MKYFVIFSLVFSTLLADKVEITADSFTGDENASVGMLEGNVVIKNGDFDTLWANKAKVIFNQKKEAKKYIASGNTRFKAKLNGKEYDGSGNEITYEPKGELYTLSGNAYLHEVESDKKLYGSKITVDRKKGLYNVYSGDKKPVKFIFEIDNKK